MSQLPGDGHLAVAADVAKPDAVEAAVNKALDGLGGIDVLVNNAGIGIYHRITEVSYGEWQKAWRMTLDANLLGPANLCFCVARHMIRNGGGRK